MAITVRVIDTSTSEIMLSAKGEGVSSRSGLMLGGGGISMGSSDFRETILGEATEIAVKQRVGQLIAKKDLLPAQ